MYIIVWRNSHREPFIDVDFSQFMKSYYSYEEANADAEEIVKNENEGERSPWYFDYQIYKECND